MPCHPELVEGSRGNETSLYVCHFKSFRYREIATLNKSARNDTQPHSRLNRTKQKK